MDGSDQLSEGQRALVRRAVMIQTQCELLETKFAQKGGMASRIDLDLYQRCRSVASLNP
jgi:hypothetical protein